MAKKARKKHYRQKKVKLRGVNDLGLDAPFIMVLGGELPYLWIGDENKCVGWIDDVRTVRKLRDMCDDYLESRGKTDG